MHHHYATVAAPYGDHPYCDGIAAIFTAENIGHFNLSRNAPGGSENGDEK